MIVQLVFTAMPLLLLGLVLALVMDGIRLRSAREEGTRSARDLPSGPARIRYPHEAAVRVERTGGDQRGARSVR